MNNLPDEINRRILVIDDNRAIHEDFRKILCPDTAAVADLAAAAAGLFGQPGEVVRKICYTIDSAYQGQEGLARVREAVAAGRPYALAFVDVRMPPGWDGVETSRNIWAVDPEIQIVLCTAYADYSWDELFEKIGNRDGLLILKKPFDTVEALQLAHALTEKWRLHRQSRQKMEELEGRVAERTAELAKSVSLLHATLESTTDGIVALDRSGRIASYNTKFTDIWHLPAAMLARRDAAEMRNYVAGLVKEPARFLRRTQNLQADPEAEGFDVIELNDGRIFERYVFPQRIDRECVGSVVNWRDITERRRAEESLRESEERFSGAFEHAPIGVALVSPEGRWIKVNRALCELVGYSEAELLARTFQDITVPDDLKADLEHVRRMLAGEIRSYQMEKRYVHARGHAVTVLLNVSLVSNAQNQPLYFIAQIQDITERKRLEAQLFQSQKLETVGKLAGGFAHEFNSILTAIIGQGELLLGELPAGSRPLKNVVEINQAAGRAAKLTRQLLAYGRKQFLQPEILDLNRVVAGMEGVFQHLLGGGVDIRFVSAPDLRMVKADAGQIEQVIMNLLMNARDAMPNGGKLTLETANVTFDQESIGRYPELKPGRYVMLAITDTGLGMSEETKARIFEPFFTTKDVGQGTGLGLSTCYGIIKQSGGHISAYSEPGRGASFKVYLPQAEPAAAIPAPQPAPADLPRGTETILLVEDDPALREMAATLLRRLGYRILPAANGIEALSLKQQRDIGHIDLLFTDVVMPHMSGRELADRVRAVHPSTRILFTSAYTENAIVHQGVLEQGVALLQKPFTPSALAHKLREVLDQPRAPRAETDQSTFGFTEFTHKVNTP